MMTQQNNENTDYDNPWKSLIELYFRDFLAFFFPHIETEVDWSKPIRFLDKELQKVVRDAEIPKRYADKLVQIHRKNGQPAIVICHAEVQNEGEKEFGARMYSYNYRLTDRYNLPVVSLAILTDDSKKWRPTGFQQELWGCSIDFKFPIVKLLDYQKDWAALETSPNPFAVVVMVQLKTKETMNLPEEFERKFQMELKTFEEARQMKYVTTIERMAEARGKELGEELGEARGEARGKELGETRQKEVIALNLLKENIPLETIARSTGLTIEQVQKLQAEQE
jgi:hypothetical protein